MFRVSVVRGATRGRSAKARSSFLISDAVADLEQGRDVAQEAHDAAHAKVDVEQRRDGEPLVVGPGPGRAAPEPREDDRVAALRAGLGGDRRAAGRRGVRRPRLREDHQRPDEEERPPDGQRPEDVAPAEERPREAADGRRGDDR